MSLEANVLQMNAMLGYLARHNIVLEGTNVSAKIHDFWQGGDSENRGEIMDLKRLTFSSDYRVLLRITGIMAWLFMIFILLNVTHAGARFPTRVAGQIWISLWLIFLVALLGSTSPRPWLIGSRSYLLALQVILALGMRFEQPQVQVAIILLSVTWQVVMFFELRRAFFWLIAQLIGYALIDYHERSLSWTSFGSQSVHFIYTLCTCSLLVAAKSEGTIRLQQAQQIADLKARQEFLAQNSRLSERLRIARELHDALGHGLTALSLHLEVALNGRRPEDIETNIHKAQAVARGMLFEVRNVVGSLRSSSESVDLLALLESLVGGTPGLNVYLSKPDSILCVNSDHAHAVVRCVQEIITNTLKHAEAKSLWLNIEVEKGLLRLTAIDDGKGGYSDTTEGKGIQGMKERFQELGGDVNVSGSSNRGFSVTARLPLAEMAIVQ